MIATTGSLSRFACMAAILLSLSACTTSNLTASVEEPPATPMTGETNDPAPGFENVSAGSEEDFILNVGRRTYFTQDSAALDAALRKASALTFDRIDSDGCMSTNDTVLLLASGASGVTPSQADLEAAVLEVCASLARQLIADAEGASKDIEIEVRGAASEQDALDVARAVSRSNLLKCALHGEDPNWGRILAAVGTTDAVFDELALDAAINGVWVCRNSAPGEDPATVDMSGREISIVVDLKAGSHAVSLWTNDLTAAYVHENSAYST